VDAAVKAANEGGKMGEEVVGCALQVLACVMALSHKAQQQDVVGIFLKDRHLLSLVKDLAEREGRGHAVGAGGAAAGRDGRGGGGGAAAQPASLFMAQVHTHTHIHTHTHTHTHTHAPTSFTRVHSHE
jgi:hypothetical protein